MGLELVRELPEVSSIAVDGDLIELGFEQRIELVPGIRGERVVLTGNSGGQFIVVIGHIVEHENVEGGIPEVFCRMKIKGSYVEFNSI